MDGVLVREARTVREHDSVEHATRALLDSDLPALAVLDAADRLAGVFGERECVAAMFPGYPEQLPHAGFVPRTLDYSLERDQGNRDEPVLRYLSRERVDVGPTASSLEVAGIFSGHRVASVLVVDQQRVQGVIITRKDFFQATAGRFLG